MTHPILLSILIPTVVGREEEYSKLVSSFFPFIRATQKHGIYTKEHYRWYLECGDNIDLEKTTILPCNIEFISLSDNKDVTIGEKREELYKLANGIFSWQIDDDDSIAPNAIELILNAIRSNPEVSCITFREKCTMNGEYKSSNHSLKYSQWMDNSDGYDYVRSPFYKDVIRTDIAKSVPFHRVRYNEDELFAKDIYPLLTSEIHIDEELYYYIYEPKESHNERYGIHD